MLGMGSVEMGLAYLACILAAVLCVIYGLVKWNDMGRYGEHLEEKIEWERKDKKIREQLP
ncbi:MAG: symporter small accessory protein [Thermodesulfobacteriota bacterium]